MDMSAPITAQRKHEASAAAPARILLAEDHAISGEIITMMGRHLGVAIDHAQDGLEALSRIRRAARAGKPYSLLLLDAMMPILGGVEVAERLRAEGFSKEDLPIIAVTAATAPDEVKSYLAAGMQAYLAKPISITDLARTLGVWAPEALAVPVILPNDDLLKRYEERKHETFKKIACAIDTGDVSEPTIAEIRALLHKLAGTAGSFGEPALSEKSAHCGANLVDCNPAELTGILSKFTQALEQ